MEDFQSWVCIYTADSLLEASLLRALLENRGIQVSILSAPVGQLHDYLHDKGEQVRIFVPATDLEVSQRYTEDFVQSRRVQLEYM